MLKLCWQNNAPSPPPRGLEATHLFLLLIHSNLRWRAAVFQTLPRNKLHTPSWVSAVLYHPETFLVTLVRLAGTKLHLPGRGCGCVQFVARLKVSRGFPRQASFSAHAQVWSWVCHATRLVNSTLFSTKACVSINELLQNELLRKDRTSSFSPYCEVGKRVLKFRANFCQVFELLYSNDRSNYVQIQFSTVLHVAQPLRDKSLKRAFRSSEKSWKPSKTHQVSFFRLYCNICRFSREFCCFIFDRLFDSIQILLGGLHCRHVGVQNKIKFAHKVCIKMEVKSQGRKILLCHTTKMAAMT